MLKSGMHWSNKLFFSKTGSPKKVDGGGAAQYCVNDLLRKHMRHRRNLVSASNVAGYRLRILPHNLNIIAPACGLPLYYRRCHHSRNRYEMKFKILKKWRQGKAFLPLLRGIWKKIRRHPKKSYFSKIQTIQRERVFITVSRRLELLH